MKVNDIVTIVGGDFHNYDTDYVGLTGRIIEVIEDGWCEGCVVVDLGDHGIQTFLSDDVN